MGENSNGAVLGEAEWIPFLKYFINNPKIMTNLTGWGMIRFFFKDNTGQNLCNSNSKNSFLLSLLSA